jgi:hypothetical protein
MYLSMNSTDLTNEAMRQVPGTLPYELAESLGDDLEELSDDNEKLENESEEFANRFIDLKSEAVYRIEQVEDILNDTVTLIPDHQEKGTYRDIHDQLKTSLELLNDAVIYFNKLADF